MLKEASNALRGPRRTRSPQQRTRDDAAGPGVRGLNNGTVRKAAGLARPGAAMRHVQNRRSLSRANPLPGCAAAVRAGTASHAPRYVRPRTVLDAGHVALPFDGCGGSGYT